MNSNKQTSRRQSEPCLRSAPTPFGKVAWNVSHGMVCLGIALFVWGTGHQGYADQTAQTAVTSSGEERPVHHVVSGTLDQLDFDSGKGLLKTDLGKPVFFDMAKPELFRRLSLGQRVTIGMDEQGKAVKVMEVPPVELPVPPSAAQ
ncbi:MAG TPA: hypothetical protein VLE46_07060 [Nitrospira sp.]|jgi:hypothetical protein|nr:hypothetical protein [Nitrospira sp.]